MALPETLDALRAKHAAELAKAEKWHATQTAVTAALNLDGAAWSAGSMHAHRADCFIVRHAADLPAALHMAETFASGPLAMARVKRSGLSFVPVCRVKPEEEAAAEPVTPYVYKLDGVKGYPETRTLIWYAEAAGRVVEVRCAVESDPLTRRIYEPIRDHRNRITGYKREVHNASGYFPRVVRWWASEGEPGAFTLWAD